MSKETPSAPPAPDYNALAATQGAQNVETARVQAQLNNPNFIGPNGSRTVDWGKTFDQAGYDKAMAAYNAGTPAVAPTYGWSDSGNNGWSEPTQVMLTPGSAGSGTTGTAPTREQFTKFSDTPTITDTLSPTQQSLLDSQGRISQNLAGVAETGLNRVSAGMATPFDTSQLTQRSALPATSNFQNFNERSQYNQAIPQADSESANRVAQAMYLRAAQPLAYQNTLQNNAALTGGHNYGGAAMNAIADNQNRGWNDLALGSVLAGGQEQSRLFDLQMRQAQLGDTRANTVQAQGLQNAGFNNQNAAAQFNQGTQLFGLNENARARDIEEQSYLRSLPLNELNALRSGSQVTTPQFQQYTGGGTIAPPPTMQGATLGYQAALGPYNAQLASNNAMTQGLFGLGGAGLGAYGNYAGLAALGA